jgi:hypothetical protein
MKEGDVLDVYIRSADENQFEGRTYQSSLVVSCHHPFTRSTAGDTPDTVTIWSEDSDSSEQERSMLDGRLPL